MFEPPVEDESINEFEYIEYLPNNFSNTNKLGEHKIEIRDLDEYLLPHTVLDVQGKLIKAADSSDYAATEVVPLVKTNGRSFNLSKTKSMAT